MDNELNHMKSALALDEDLIRRLNRGDQAAFTVLYNKYVDMVFGFLSRLLKDDGIAEDLTQFCFMQIWIHRKQISFRKSLPAYLYVMARNAAYKEFRKQILAATYIDASMLEDEPYQPENYGDVDIRMIEEEIRKCVEALPASRRKIYIMSRFEGLKTEEIAERLDISPSTVDVQIHRAKQSLRIALSKIFIILTITSL